MPNAGPHRTGYNAMRQYVASVLADKESLINDHQFDAFYDTKSWQPQINISKKSTTTLKNTLDLLNYKTICWIRKKEDT
jgi:hypothetical protein